MLAALDADGIRRWSRAALASLEAHRDEIDALNVFPVPDSDTGRNLVTTVRAADAALTRADPVDAPAALAAMASGAARGALGNSGFIVSQILRGFADVTASVTVAPGSTTTVVRALDARAVAEGLARGAELARAAVVNPVEGTILTVARAAAEGAVGERLFTVVDNAVGAAERALGQTPMQLPVLARAGVVDAGGRGLLVLLDALLRTVTESATETVASTLPATGLARHDPEPEGISFGFEVQYLLEAPDSAIDQLRQRLAQLGDSVAVVSTGAQRWNIHAHVDDVGAAIEAGVQAGRPHEISVVRFSDVVGSAVAEPVIEPTAAERAQPGVAVLAIAPGTGLSHLFEAERVGVVEGRVGQLPGVEEILAAIELAHADDVILLPNVSRITGVADEAAARARTAGLRVSVVPTRSPVQGLAAIAVHDASRRFDDDVVAMAEAAAATRYAELRIAEQRLTTMAGTCAAGEVLGLIDGEVVELGPELLATGRKIVDRLLGVGAELMTMLIGADVPPELGSQLSDHVRANSPLTDVTVYPGGRSDSSVIIGVE